MNGQPPPIDARDRQDIVEETTALAMRYSDWRPRPDGQPDAGQALIGIFAHFADLVVQRINRVPERDYLAFLNLIGTRPQPPLPARVPLTFSLAERSPADAVVPAGTQVAATALEGEDDEVVFETETPLVVTRAQLRAVFVDDAENDRYADRTERATGLRDEAFEAFAGDQPVPHQLFIACDPVLTRPGSKDVTLVLTTQGIGAQLLDGWPISWAYWDGASWRPLSTTEEVRGAAWRVRLTGLPELPPYEVNGISAGWLRAQLDMAMPMGESGLAPELVAVGGRPPQEEVAGVFPFGETTQGRLFYLSADDAIAAGGAIAHLTVTLARPGIDRTAVRLVWSYKVGSEWRELGQSSSRVPAGSTDTGLVDRTQAFTRAGDVSFRVPPQWPREVFRGRYGRWLRVEIVDDGGSYATLPQIGTITAGYSWELPTVSGIDVQLDTPPQPSAPPAAFGNNSPLDLTKDFYPFGEQPRFNDTFYLACPDDLARPGSTVVLSVTLTNAKDGPVPPVRGDGGAKIAWEAWNGTGWLPVTVDSKEYAFLGTATVRLTLPAGFARTEVNGSEQYWLRVRLAGGNYGVAAGYREKPDGYYTRNADGTYTKNPGGAYELTPATFSPPVISKLSFTPGQGQAALTPASACVTTNGFRPVTLRRDTGALQPFQPFIPAPDTDPALYLGFDQRFDTRPVTLYLWVEPPAPEEVAADRLAELDPADRAHLVWEYSGPAGWQPLAALDETDTLASRGVVQFVGPADLLARECFGQTWCWLRLRWIRGTFPVAPRLRRVQPNTTWATQATTVSGELLGSGTAESGQGFVTAQTPVLAGQRLEVREEEAEDPGAEEVWVPWTAVTDFTLSGPQDRHYTLDPRTGEILFGDGQAGRLVPRGQNNIRITYRIGGGAAGNRATGTIVTLKSAVPHVDSVTNHERSQGGSPWEPLERVRIRGPKSLRHRDRAVTAEDFEDIAFESSADVARVRAVLPSGFEPFDLWLDPADPKPGAGHVTEGAGRVGLIVVPDSAEPRPAPSLGLLREVQAYLRARCCATTGLWVAGPEWIRVTVTATVVPLSPDVAELVRGRVKAALDRYLHPLTGGPRGDGWAFGRKPHRSDLFGVAEAVEGVDHVGSLEVAQAAESDTLGDRLDALLRRSLTDTAAQTPAPELTRWLSRALVYSGPHEITVTLRG